MGIRASKSNQDLNDRLIKDSHLVTPVVESVLRSVDRALFQENTGGKYTPYHDEAWKKGNLHLSAPCIYARVMEALDLKPGMSFLNLGSGTGYLSTLVGLMIGPHGINHGIELHQDVVDYANRKLKQFKQQSYALDKHNFVEPTFIQGNCLNLDSTIRRYDRIYLGAACPPEQENYMKDLIKVGGILVMPINDQLVRYQRVDECNWNKQCLLSVVFAAVVVREEKQKLDLPEIKPKSLTEICRDHIRNYIRSLIDEKYPEIKFSDNLKQRNLAGKNRKKRKLSKRSQRQSNIQTGKHTQSTSKHNEGVCTRSRSKSIASIPNRNGNNSANQSAAATSNRQRSKIVQQSVYIGSLHDSSSSSSESDSISDDEDLFEPARHPMHFMISQRLVSNRLESGDESKDSESNIGDGESSDANNTDYDSDTGDNDYTDSESDSDRAEVNMVNIEFLRNVASVFRIGEIESENENNENDSDESEEDEYDEDHHEADLNDNESSSIPVPSSSNGDRKWGTASNKDGASSADKDQVGMEMDPDSDISTSYDEDDDDYNDCYCCLNDSYKAESSSFTQARRFNCKKRQKQMETDDIGTRGRSKKRKNLESSSISGDDKNINEETPISSRKAKDDFLKPGCSNQDTRKSLNNRIKAPKSISDDGQSKDANRPTSNTCSNHRKICKNSPQISSYSYSALKHVKDEKKKNGKCAKRRKKLRPRKSESRKYFDLMRNIIIELQLPHVLKLYLNYDRKLTNEERRQKN